MSRPCQKTTLATPAGAGARKPHAWPHIRPAKAFFFSSRRRHTRCLSDWSSDVCSSDLMMAHEVRVMPHKTFRFNLAVCPPYNADFDGDEMNLHVLQSEEARAEARVLMRVQEHILSPRFGGPVIGGIHDHISGSFFLTHKDSKFTREEVTFILTKIDMRELPRADVKKGGKEFWTGKALFSAILPKDLSMTFKSSIAPKGDIGLKELKEEDSLVVIKNGVVSSGTIDENAAGAV